MLFKGWEALMLFYCLKVALESRCLKQICAIQSPAAAWERWEPGKEPNCQVVSNQTSFRCWRKPNMFSVLFNMKLKTAAEKSPSRFWVLLCHFSAGGSETDPVSFGGGLSLWWVWFFNQVLKGPWDSPLGVPQGETHHPFCPSHLAGASSALPEASPSYVLSPRKLL